MNEKLHHLLRRIVSPLVAPRLAKEELCLSMAAVSRLCLRQEEVREIPLDAIVTRAQRVSHLCSPTELGMISDGVGSLFCMREDLADTLVCDLYAALHKGTPTRIDHVTAVVRYTNKLELYSNETVPVLLEHATKLLHKKDTRSVLESFLRLARMYVPDEKFSEIVEELRKRASTDQLECLKEDRILSSIEKTPHKEVKPKGKEKEERTNDENEEQQTAWTLGRARSWLSQRVGKDGTLPPGEITQAMELYSHFGIRDPVLRNKIEDMTVSFIPRANKIHLNEIRKVITVSSHLFPRTSELLLKLRTQSSEGNNNMDENNGNESTSSLIKNFKTSEAYERLLMGRRISEDSMFDVLQEQNASLPIDVTAQAACIFAEKGEIPEGIILQLSTQLHELSPEGVAAFIRAMRRDSSGALSLHNVTVFHHFAGKGVREATVDALLRICRAFALPPPRGMDVKDHDNNNNNNNNNNTLFLEAQGRLRESVTTRLLAVMQESSAIPFLCKIIKNTSAMDVNNELPQFLCSRVCAGKQLNVKDALDLLDTLWCRNYIHEPLVDMMEPLFRELVESVVSKVELCEEISYCEIQQVSKFILLQSFFDIPDFDAAASLLLHTVEQNVDRIPGDILSSIGLLCLRRRRNGTLRIILEKLNETVSKLSNEALSTLVRLLSENSGEAPPENVVNEVLSVITERLAAAYQGVLEPDTVGLSIAIHCRYTAGGGSSSGQRDLIPESVTEYLLEWMGALSSDVYTELCSSVHLSHVGDALTNELLNEFSRRLDQLTTRQIADVVFGLGEIDGVGQRLSHQLVAEKCSDYVIDHSDEFWSGRDIARVLYGFSRMLCTKRSLYNVFATRLAQRPILLLMDQKMMSLVVGAFGRAKYLDKKLFDKFSRHMLEHSDNLNAPDLMLAIRGFSRVMLLNEPLYNELGNKAAEKANEFPLETQCTLLASFGSLGIEHEKLATRMIDSIVEKLPELENANKAVDVIASLWQMNHEVESDAKVAQLADWVVERSGELSDKSIGKLCSVLNERNWRHVPLMKAMAERSVQLQVQQSVSPECCRALLDTLGTFMIHHQGARENLSSLGRSVSKEKILLSEDEQQEIQLLLRR